MGRSVTTLLDDVELTDDTQRITAGATVVISDLDWSEVSPFALGRSVADAVVTANSPTVTSATAAFVAGDVGKLVSGPKIPSGARVITRNSATSITIGTIRRNELNEHIVDPIPAASGGAAQTLIIGVISDGGAA